jgi:hypothetical protein
MLIDLNFEDDADDFDTADFAEEPPERVAKAIEKLIETIDDLKDNQTRWVKAMRAIGLSIEASGGETFFIRDRAKAVEAHARLLAEHDAEETA